MPLPINYFISRSQISKKPSQKNYFYKTKINSFNNNINDYTKNYSNNNTNNNYNKEIKNDKNPTTDNITNIKILYSYGDLYEYKKNQTLHLYVNIPINPRLLTNITFITRNKSKLYHPKTECFYINNFSYDKVTSLDCILDLSYIGKGDYFIYYFYYNNINIYDNITLITIKESEEKKKENISEGVDLIGVLNDGYEYSKYQNITLFFKNNNININLITNITILNENKRRFGVPLECLYKGLNDSVFCLADFSIIPADNYKIEFLLYNYEPYTTPFDIWFNIHKIRPKEEVPKLLYVSGEVYKDFPNLKLVFNKEVNPKDFNFYLRDFEKLNLQFNLYYINCNAYNTSMECQFNFTYIPKGLYYFNYYYKSKKYETNITIDVKEKEILTENELIEVYHNFKRYKDNQIAFFTFYGKNPSNNLAYIVLNDGYSRINVLQTLGCKMINYDNIEYQYDLKCILNLTYVNDGKYTVSEYYINNKHYYTKNKIDIIVG